MKQNEADETTRPSSWPRKFSVAFAGIAAAVKTENSFYVHLPVAVIVIAAAIALKMNSLQICLLLFAISGVLVSELFNTSIESMARAVSGKQHDQIGRALDISSGAVLLATLFACSVGGILFGTRIFQLFFAG